MGGLSLAVKLPENPFRGEFPRIGRRESAGPVRTVTIGRAVGAG
jgi:hypothetical protein